MTIYFAAARSSEHAAIARALSPTVQLTHANDNSADLAGDQAMRAALELFARHGLGAARQACERAQMAASQGDDRECRHWLSICRMLDQRLADSWASRLGVARIA